MADTHTYPLSIQYIAQNGRSCQIDEDLIGADYLPLETAPFLQYLSTALDAGRKHSSAASGGVGACGLARVESAVTCPPLKASQARKWEKDNAQAAAKGKPRPWPGQFERANYRKRFEVVASVSGYGLNSNVDAGKLASAISSNVNQRLRLQYAKGFKCKYAVKVEIAPVTGAWMTHCHLQYHMDLNLLLPVLIGVDRQWPTPPADWPLGAYTMY